MSDDEQAIRTLIDTWLAASRAGDTATTLRLMTDDVVFLTPGQKPFGKKEFAASAERMKGVRLDAESRIEEIAVRGDWAFTRTHLAVTITPPNGSPMRRSGYTLSILEKRDGAWAIARDANLLAPEQDQNG